MRTLWKTLIILIVTSMSFIGCRADRPSTGFKPASSLLSPQGSQQLNKLDILWVVDNSGSMAASQANLAGNFSSFVSGFQARGYDFKLAAVGTDAYKADNTLSGYSAANSSLADFRTRTSCYAGYPNCYLMAGPITPSIVWSTDSHYASPFTSTVADTFIANAMLGTAGAGDERAFSSFRAALNAGANSTFLRPDSFLVVIVLSDEDDFSGNTRAVSSNDTHDYNAATLDPISTYTSFLDTKTGTSGIFRRYSVSTITVDTNACCNTYYGTTSGHCTKQDAQGNDYLGTRYMQLASATNGVVGSVCDASYATALANISSQITVLSTQFTLDYPAQVSTIYVAFDGVQVPQSATNGWTYNSSLQAVQFHGTYTPTQNTSIYIDYLPAY